LYVFFINLLQSNELMILSHTNLLNFQKTLLHKNAIRRQPSNLDYINSLMQTLFYKKIKKKGHYKSAP